MNELALEQSDGAIFKDSIWFRLLFSTAILAGGSIAIEEELVTVLTTPLFVALSVLFFVKARTYISVDENLITLRGFLATGRLKQLPVNKIESIDTVETSGVANFRVWFDPGISRSKFWRGTDNLLIVNPLMVDNCLDLIETIMSYNKTAAVAKSVHDFIDGKKQLKSRAGISLFAGLALLFATVSLVLILQNL